MKATRTLAILLAILLTATVFSGCGGKSVQPVRRYRFDADKNALICVFTTPDADHVEKLCYDEETGQHKPDRALVKVTVLTPETVVVTELEEPTFEHYDHLVEKPLRIDEVYHAGADVPLQAGDRITVEKYCDVEQDPYTLVEYFTIDAPLAEGYEYFVYLTYDADTGYTLDNWYPVDDYIRLPCDVSTPAAHGKATREFLIEKYGE